jgi:DNA repair photolyase
MKFKKDSYRGSFSKRDGLSIFPTAHDIFPFNKMLCFKYLKKIITPRPSISNNAMVVSKARFSVFKHFAHFFKDLKNHLEIRFTLTTQDNDLINLWEGHSSNYEERIQSLNYCYDKDYKISVVIEPYLSDLNDLYSMVDELSSYDLDTIWIGKMNRISSKKKLLELGYGKKIINAHQRIRNISSKKHLSSIISNLENNRKIRYKESFIKKVGKQIPPYQLNYSNER